jgi:hypothetical protein
MVTLWHLLMAVCFVMPLAGALAGAKLSKAGFGGYALVVTVGLALGLCFAWTMWTVGKIVAAHTKGKPVPAQEWYARALYFGAALWIPLGLFLGNWVSSAVLKLVQ